MADRVIKVGMNSDETRVTMTLDDGQGTRLELTMGGEYAAKMGLVLQMNGQQALANEARKKAG